MSTLTGSPALKVQVMCEGIRYTPALGAAAAHSMPNYYPFRFKPGEHDPTGRGSVTIPYLINTPDGTEIRILGDGDSPWHIEGSQGAGYELIDDRGADYKKLDVRELVAENSWNGAIVLGEFRKTWPDLEAILGTVELDGAKIDEGHGRDVLGHPFEPLTWLANHLNARGSMLRQGDVVLTGSMAPTRFPKPGDRFRFTLEGLGTVAADFIA